MRRTRILFATAILLAGLFLSASTLASPATTSIYFGEPTYTLQDGTTLDTSLVRTPSGSGGAVTYLTANGNTATVDANGVITGVAPGRTQIKATLTSNKKTAIANIVVTATRIYASRNRLTMYVGDTDVLMYVLRPSPVSLTVTWQSTNPSVVYVDQSGNLTARGAGTAIVSARLKNGNAGRCYITVKKATVSIPSTRTLYEGQTISLSPSVSQGDVEQALSFTSLNPLVASVTQEGEVTGNLAGTTYVTANLTNGQTARCKVTVRAVTISVPTSYSMASGGQATIPYKLNPSGAAMTPTWTTSYDGVASVNASTGLVTANNPGIAYITATLPNEKWARCKVTVTAASISIQSKLTLYEEETTTLAPTVLPPGGSPAITWASSKSSIAKVSSEGVVQGRKAGTAYISAKLASGQVAYCQVTVKPRSVVIPATMTLLPGQTKALDITILPATATDQGVALRSSNTSIVTVNQAARTVTAGSTMGTAYVTAKLSNGRYATCKVTVRTQPVTGVTLSPSTADLAFGGSTYLTATVEPNDAADKTVSFSCSNTKVLSISTAGQAAGVLKVTAVGQGTATVTIKTGDGSYKATSTITVTGVPDYRAVVVAEFTDSSYYNHMAFAAYSASRVRSAIAYGRPYNAQYTITGGNNLNKNAIKNAIQAAVAPTTSDDVTIVYLLSHGINYNGEYRFVLPGWYERVGDANYAISSAELIGWLDGAKGHVVLVVNSCHSGKVATDAPSLLSGGHSLAGGKLTVLCSSSFATSSAWYNGSVKYDFMSCAFARALGYDVPTGKPLSSLPADTDKDGFVTTGELEQYTDLCMEGLYLKYRNTNFYVCDEGDHATLVSYLPNPNQRVFGK